LLKTEIHCKTTSPLFMAGADSDSPELRAPSIKGVMRYIWRAIQGAGELSQLRILEGELFGNADGDRTCRSPWRLQVIMDKPLPTTPTTRDLLPYRERNRLPTPCIDQNLTFTCRITSGTDTEEHLNMVRLFILTCILGGFGRRSRKGMGTVVVEKIEGIGENISKASTLENITALLNALSEFCEYTLDKPSSVISTRDITDDGKKKANYPYIEKVTLLNKKMLAAPEMRVRIGFAVHIEKAQNPYEMFLGAGGSERFASSLILSTIPARGDLQLCIVTQLHCTKDLDPKIRDDFLSLLEKEVKK
jgi:CRISPR-associated protein Cmr1